MVKFVDDPASVQRHWHCCGDVVVEMVVVVCGDAEVEMVVASLAVDDTGKKHDKSETFTEACELVGRYDMFEQPV